MKNLWQSLAPTRSETGALAEVVRGSRTIGAHEDLVLHGGGNSSIKDTVTDVTGAEVEVLYVKGSGWNMATIEPAGFAPLRMDRLRELLSIESITDSVLVNELRCAMIRSDAPDASIEALLHALLPARAVLHSHADAIVSLTNQENPEALIREIYGSDVVVIPYVMPGFDLARVCARVWAEQAGPDTRGMVLLNHGLFTFGDTMEEAYGRHVELITLAEERLGAAESAPAAPVKALDPERIARLRGELSAQAGRALIVSSDTDSEVAAFVARPDLASVASRGPATPDHVIRTKRLPLVGTDIAGYVEEYRAYFERNKNRSSEPVALLDPTPRIILDPGFGMLSVGNTVKDAQIVRDIARHTFNIIDSSERVGTYTALGEGDLFDVEYWELEQAKLRMSGAPAELAGQIALVTGASSGIGRGCAEYLMGLGAAVIAVDISAAVVDLHSDPRWLGVQADVCDPAGMAEALRLGVERFGGLDILVVAAGVFAQSSPISELDAAVWERTFAINVGSVQSLFAQAYPLLAHAPGCGRVVVIGSKNVAAPGPGAAAYSASKAALTQLARVAALEWAPAGIRVNTVHPDAVFDTGLWTEDLLNERAAKYGMSVEDYKRRNLLSAEVTSKNVARMVGSMVTETFAVTTGAQVPVDGGNDRVI
ncbi:bifunctional aldolase/short-chain dehydrogenase [Mycetocola spongiae]|uniref:bifunctional aldolase/short-chain dehydrogenase n=1 Tax=Mycetocola spongiae TaxID=2859226 RepID=UPI001CF43ED8|nr:bifunctional aldolase/short-chain dehydrogenase [Mycetocola spongiae]UCR88866.1 bifunctional aldolase/short-chain dehydrogenase [Mycetocola spongiae]